MPIQGILILGMVLLSIFLLKRGGWAISTPTFPEWRRLAVAFLIGSLIIAGPFMWKSWSVAGTPLYPFFPNAAFQANAQSTVPVRDAYGEARTLVAWVRHFWTIAVPSSGVYILDTPPRS